MKKRITTMIAAVAAVGGALYAYQAYQSRHPSTDNAYITANVVHVAPQVGGRVAEVLVSNQAYVRTGDPLYKIDPKPFALALEQTQAHWRQVR